MSAVTAPSEWLAGTSWSIALHESLYLYPLIESTHVLTLTLFVGLTVMLDLRLLGLTMKQVPASEVTARLLPWTKAGFVIMVITGAAAFLRDPGQDLPEHLLSRQGRDADSGGAECVAVSLARGAAGRGLGFDAVYRPSAARVAAIVSLILWAGIVVAGRMIAYNWFDCDIQPQADFINWAAGCVVPPR